MTRPKKNRHIAQYYAKEETAALLEMAKDGPIYVPILLAAYYGLRWSAVDFEKKTLMVNHKVAQVREDGKPIVYAEDKLKQWQEERRRVFGKSYSKEYLDYICVNEKGELFKPNYISGRSSFPTTADIYSHIDFSAKLQSAEAIGKALGC